MRVIDHIRDVFSRKAIEKILRKQKREKHYPDFRVVKSVLILFESDLNEQNNEIIHIVKELKDEGKQVVAWGFVNKKENGTLDSPDFRILSKKDLKTLGIPSAKTLFEYRNIECELLIDLSSTNCTPVNYLLAISKAPFKVSRKKSFKGISDLMVDTNSSDDIDYLYRQILFYLNSIQAKN